MRQCPLSFQCNDIILTLHLSSSLPNVHSAAPRISKLRNAKVSALKSANGGVSVVYGTSTGSTGDVAEAIYAEIKSLFGSGVCNGVFCVDDLAGNEELKTKIFGGSGNIICGTPTWNTGADTMRSGTGWDDFYYSELSDMSLEGINSAVFGLGDQESYGANYADGAGELHDVLVERGCKVFGITDIDDSYVHEESKSERDGKFVGLMLDEVNQSDLTEGRVKSWIKQLQSEGFFGGGGDAVAQSPQANDVEQTVAQSPQASEVEQAVAASELPQKNDQQGSNEVDGVKKGWKSFYNEETKSTLWVNQSNRSESCK